MKRAFSLVELLVVIGIIAVLAGILLATLSGSSDSARSARCMSNMRNLAAACQTYGAAKGSYPLAGSVESMYVDESDGIADAKTVYREVPGWISWNSRNAYRNKPTSHQASSSWFSSLYSTDREEYTHCLTNGTLWKYVSSTKQTYICPDHARMSKRLGTPQWSYLMNAYFGWDTSKGGEAQGTDVSNIGYGHLKNADRLLLFSEVQFLDVGLPIPQGSGSGTDCDCVLQYDTSAGSAKNYSNGANDDSGSGSECIGCNHVVGRNLFAHVAFADGHVEKLRIPFSGSVKNPQVDATQMRNLTTWLCKGLDVNFDGRTYQRAVEAENK